MARTLIFIGAAALLCWGCAMETESVGEQAEALGTPAACFVTGGGVITTGDNFGGVARESSGRWTHRTAAGDRFRGTVERTDCLANGGGPAGPPQELINRAFVFGSGTWNGEEATFTLTLADRGEPNVRDEYGIVVFVDSVLVYVGFGLVERGNLQIHAAP